jgi:hypothetical protein
VLHDRNLRNLRSVGATFISSRSIHRSTSQLSTHFEIIMQTSGDSLPRDLIAIFNVHVQFNPLLPLTAGDVVAKNTRASMQEARALHMCFSDLLDVIFFSDSASSAVVIGHLIADTLICVKSPNSICLLSGKRRAEQTRAPKTYRVRVTRNSDDNINNFFCCIFSHSHVRKNIYPTLVDIVR